VERAADDVACMGPRCALPELLELSLPPLGGTDVFGLGVSGTTTPIYLYLKIMII